MVKKREKTPTTTTTATVDDTQTWNENKHKYVCWPRLSWKSDYGFLLLLLHRTSSLLLQLLAAQGWFFTSCAFAHSQLWLWKCGLRSPHPCFAAFTFFSSTWIEHERKFFLHFPAVFLRRRRSWHSFIFPFFSGFFFVHSPPFVWHFVRWTIPIMIHK